MTTLTVTSRGQVTFRKDILIHLGIRPGDKLRIDMLPNGRAELSAARQEGTWEALRGILDGHTNGTSLTIEEINEVIAEAGSAADLAEK